MNTNKKIAISAITFLLSLVMLVCSFLPVLTLTTDGSVLGTSEIKVGISAINNVSFLFDATKKLDEEELMESELYEDFIVLSEDFLEEYEYYISKLPESKANEITYDELPRDIKSYVTELTVLTARLAYQSESTQLTAFTLGAGVLSLLYIAVSVLLAVISLLSLLLTLGIVRLPRFDGMIRTVACVAPTVALMLLSVSLIGFSDSESTSFAPIIVYISASLIMVGIFAAERIDFKKFKFTPSSITSLFSSVIAVLIIASALLPVFSSTIKTTFKGRTNESEVVLEEGIDFIDNLHVDKETDKRLDSVTKLTAREKREIIKSAFDGFANYKAIEVRHGDDNGHFDSFFETLAALRGLHNLYGVFRITAYLYLLIILFAGYVLYKKLLLLSSGSDGNTRIAFIISSVLALATLIFIIVLVAMLNSYVKKYGALDYSVSVASGSIIMLILSALGALIPSRISPRASVLADGEDADATEKEELDEIELEERELAAAESEELYTVDESIVPEPDEIVADNDVTITLLDV